jgi:glycerol-3-phosphate cytidylyltransferase
MKIGFTASTFDLLHAGHIIMLKEAKEQCDFLIVGLQVDPSKDRASKNSPVQSLFERQIQISAVKYVDEVIVYETEQDLKDILESVHIDIRILGEEYKDIEFTGAEICKRKGIELYFNSRTHRFSTSALRKLTAEKTSSQVAKT